MCETMWGTSFKYEDDTSKDAYVMSFTEGQTNPNNAMFASKGYPNRCDGELGAVNLTKAEEDGCPANWHLSSESYLTSGAACVSTKAVGAGIAAAAAAALLA